MSPTTTPRGDGIAVIGMSGRFPGAPDLDAYWRNLRAGVESISHFTDAELAAAGVGAAARAHPNFVGAAGVLADVDLFDAHFFGFSARDAEVMDPQQRLLLECAWEAMEDAGQDFDRFPGRVGVFAGQAPSSYLHQLYANPERLGHANDMQLLLHNDKDHLTTHVSYKLNLRGPSLAVGTACSTSLVAIALACESLWGGRCDVALAGGSAIAVPQRRGHLYQPGGIMSPDGRCRAFDAGSRGTVGGNGVGVVVLKPLARALADGDHVYAVVRGTGVANDGAVKVGYTAPGVEGQADAIALALDTAGVSADTVGYVEAHGTGTQLGDPIEFAALRQVFRRHTARVGYCAVGSVKTNIGHLDPAAGVAGFIKVVLALQHGELPASLHFETPNPELDLPNSPFFVNTRLRPWPAEPGAPRRAGVNAFGIGGTNAHVLVEEAPPPVPSGPSRPHQLLVLSAKTPAALEARTDQLAAWLGAHPGERLADAAATLQRGRKPLAHRRVLVVGGDDAEGAARALAEREPSRVLTGATDGTARPVAFLFPGQGAQYPGMGAGLYAAEPTYRATVDACAEQLAPWLGFDLRAALFPEDAARDEAAALLRRTAVAQPALFVTSLALARLWAEWGVAPQAMAGHSVGEYAAACLAGVLGDEDALALVAARGSLMEAMPEGAMLAVPLAADEAHEYARALAGDAVSVAAVNAPELCALSGPTAVVEALAAALAARGLPCRPLHTSHAFHSAMMDAAVWPFVERVRGVRLRPPAVPYLSNVTGTWITAEEATAPAYYGRHLRETVRFADNVAELLADPDWACVEVGPGHTLASLVRQQPAGRDRLVVGSLPSPARERPDGAAMLEGLGRLWAAGVPVDWDGFLAHEQRRRLRLPTYPFERQRYWIGTPDRPEDAPAAAAEAAAARRRAPSDWLYAPVWAPSPPAAAEGDTPDAEGAPGPGAPWLVFADACGLGDALAAALAARGTPCAVVRPGDAFAERAEAAEFTVRPDEPRDYDALLERLSARGAAPGTIAHLWNVTAESAPPDADPREALAALPDGEDAAFHRPILLAQAIGRRPMGAAVRLAVVADGLYQLTGSEPLHPAKALALGPCRVIPAEYPHVDCRCVDVAGDELLGGGEALGALAARLAAEFEAAPPSGVVAYRGGERYVESWAPIPADATPGAGAPIRERGVYLVTGGLGGIGLALAEHLARTARARLVLTARTALPARDLWDGWAAEHGGGDPASRAMAAVRRLEALGAEVMVAAADVADEHAMRRVVDEAVARFGALNGVVHSAGVAGGGIVQLKTPELAARVLRPKVLGTLVLDAVTRPHAPDFVALCSSLTASWGGSGQADYCAANNFLDAFARRAWAEGRHVVAIEWDGWREVGMLVNTEVPEDMRAEREATLATAIAPAEGAEAFVRALEAGLPAVAVCTTELYTAADAASAGAGVAADDAGADTAAVAPAAVTHHPRPNLATAYAPPSTDAERTLVNLWQDLLGVAPVGVHDNFFELGGHSLLAVQLVGQAGAALDAELSIHALFDAPTVAKLAGRVAAARRAPADDAELMARLLAQVEELPEDEVRRLLAEASAPEP
nr:hypothetical protein [uncultured bacterium]